MPLTTRRPLAAVLTTALAAAAFTVGVAAPAAAEERQISVSGVLHPGTPGQVVYEAIKPAEWNGTLILDLDFNGWNQARRSHFLDLGYAIGGNQRTQNETAYELKDYVDNLVTTRGLLMEALDEADQEQVEPTRTLAWGNSRGGFVARMAAQYQPEIFDGAIAAAGGGAGVIGSWLGKADAVWALQQLVNPDAGLAINDLPDIPPGASYGPNYEQDQRLGALVAQARADDQGLARLVLAAAFEQATDFPSGAEPPAADDYRRQGELIASGFVFGNPQFVHKEIEVMAGGPVVWNHGVDYAALLDASGARDRVEWWYAEAGLDLDADLALLAGAPRYSADPAAVAVVEQIGTYTGTGSPVITVKTIGDSADPAPLDEAYVRTFKASGNGDSLLRALLIERPGHGGQSFGEMLAALDVLEERLDTGTWPATDAATMNARVADLFATSGLPSNVFGGGGIGKYIPFDGLTPALRTWDFTNWGTYSPAAAPGAPASVAAVAANGAVRVTWAPPAATGTDPILDYTVAVSDGSAGCTTTGTTCVVSGLANGTPYAFTVTARSASGTSEPSARSAWVTPTWAPGGSNVSVTVSAKQQCVNGVAQLAVHVLNKESVKIDVRITTANGEVKVSGVAPGAAVYRTFPGSGADGTAQIATYKWVDGQGVYTVYRAGFSAVTCG